MNIWAITGQEKIVDIMKSASENYADSMTHAWLITGPSGSGRSNVAYAFAASLLSSDSNFLEENYNKIKNKTHPDFVELDSEKITISIYDLRKVVAQSYHSPTSSMYKVIMIKDADRMPERSSNVLLKALEEPPEKTVWILCAPTEADMLPTIKSRTRIVKLKIPDIDEVAVSLSHELGVKYLEAYKAANYAQGHIGMARTLIKSKSAMKRREDTVKIILNSNNLSRAMLSAKELENIAAEDSKEYQEINNSKELKEAFRYLGLEPGDKIPPSLRSQIKIIEDNQKKRTTKVFRDSVDRVLNDALTVFRDMLMFKMDQDKRIINIDYSEQIYKFSQDYTEEELIDMIKSVLRAQEHLSKNMSISLVLESLLCKLHK